MNQDLTRQYVSNMLEDQVTGQHKRREMLIRRPRGKAVMMGPGAMKDMKERSLKNKGKGAENRKHFRDGEDSTLVFLSLCREGAIKQGGNIF